MFCMGLLSLDTGNCTYSALSSLQIIALDWEEENSEFIFAIPFSSELNHRFLLFP